MRRLYKLFRIVGYASGILGMLLVMLGRTGAVPQPVMAVGGGLILLMVCSFLVTYVLYLVARLK